MIVNRQPACPVTTRDGQPQAGTSTRAATDIDRSEKAPFMPPVFPDILFSFFTPGQCLWFCLPSCLFSPELSSRLFKEEPRAHLCRTVRAAHAGRVHLPSVISFLLTTSVCVFDRRASGAPIIPSTNVKSSRFSTRSAAQSSSGRLLRYPISLVLHRSQLCPFPPSPAPQRSIPTLRFLRESPSRPIWRSS